MLFRSFKSRLLFSSPLFSLCFLALTPFSVADDTLPPSSPLRLRLPGTTPPAAIAVWAYPDDNTVSGIVNIGVVSYHANGIHQVDFNIDDTETLSIQNQTINPQTQEFEFVCRLDTRTLSNGTHVVHAKAIPNSGTTTLLPELRIQVANGSVFSTWYVNAAAGDDSSGTGSTNSPFRTIHKACVVATGGDTIRCRTGTYSLPDQTRYGFSKYTTITPDSGHDVFIGGGSLRSSYIKFLNINFNLSEAQSIICSQYDHFWFDGCTLVGAGKDDPLNEASALRFYSQCRHVVVENCTIHDASVGITAIAGRYIIRHNLIFDQTADGLDYDGDNILISGNIIHNTHIPSGGTQHCDFIASNSGATQVVIRNNLCHNGDHQGCKLGGYNDGRDQPYINLAFVNNLMALGPRGSVNLRLEGTTKGKRFENILIEHNTIWNGSSSFIIEPDLDGVNIFIRNNIFGPVAVSVPSLDSVTFSNNHTPQDGLPGFADSSSWDFRLLSASACINAGVEGAGLFHDITWKTHEGVADVGAYDYNP